MSGIMKNMKRMMAGEYPRELSSKVFAGACRLVTYGFRQGGVAGYGLRRMMINERNEPKMELNRGDRKSLQTDRVILIPGPAEEIENVRWIYRAFVDNRLSESQIAALLNQRSVKTDCDRAWTRGTVREILINEKYIGHNVYNRRSFKLKKQHVKNPPDQWVRKENAFAPIVEEQPQPKTLPQAEIKAGFENATIDLEIEQIALVKTISPSVRKGRKYLQILASIRSVGIIEPPVVMQDAKSKNRYILLDGHLRLEALKELGEKDVACLISTDDEAFICT